MQEILIFLNDYGYWILAVLSFTGGYLGIIGAAFLASTGQLNIGLVLLISSLFNFLGDFFYFYYFSLLRKFFRKDYNRIMFKYRKKIAYTKLMIRKKGSYGMFIQKYIKYIRLLYPIVLSTMNYNKRKFLILNFFASIFWALSLALPTYLFAPIIMSLFK